MREALAADAEFLLSMLVETVNWDPDPSRPPMTRDDVVARPELFHYVDGWPRAGDAGLVAEDAEGQPIGAAWYRFFALDDPGYGFVDAAIPEVAIGVVASWRGQGVGRALLDGLRVLAVDRGIRALSLSVEKANPARRLYERCGYVVVSDDGGGVTMRLDLR